MDRSPVAQLSPMLASDLRDLPAPDHERIWASREYVAEEKLNGVRALLHIGTSESRLTTRVRSKRSGLFLERTDNFPHLRDLPISRFAGTVLDGELLLDKQRIFTGTTEARGSLSCTMAVCNSAPDKALAIQRREGYASFWAFDVLRVRGESVEGLAFRERRRRLEALFSEMAHARVDPSHLRLVAQTADRKRDFYDALLRDGREGVMLKHRDGLYQRAGRSRQVLKAKRSLTIDAFITGATPGRAGNAGLIGSLLVGAFDAVTGEVREIAGLAPYDLSLGPKASNLRAAMTVLSGGTPELAPGFLNRVVEVEAFCWNKNARLVHARLARFRSDKAPADCRLNFSTLEAPVAVDPGR